MPPSSLPPPSHSQHSATNSQSHYQDSALLCNVYQIHHVRIYVYKIIIRIVYTLYQVHSIISYCADVGKACEGNNVNLEVGLEKKRSTKILFPTITIMVSIAPIWNERVLHIYETGTSSIVSIYSRDERKTH